MADVDGSSAGTYYKYKGEINYASAAKLNIYVEGYYVSNGTYPVSYTHLDVYKRQGHCRGRIRKTA